MFLCYATLNEEHINKFSFLKSCQSFNNRDALFNLKIKNIIFYLLDTLLYKWQNTIRIVEAVEVKLS